MEELQKLYHIANKLSKKNSVYMGYYGKVACALKTQNGNIYTGVSLVVDCGGFCAENAAILEMLKHNETKIKYIVAVCVGDIRPPCGKCCDLIRMIDEENSNTKTLISLNEFHTIKELLPYPWIHSKKESD